MPPLTVDVPRELYPSALRVLADLLEGGAVPTTDSVDEAKGEQVLPKPWTFEELIPDDFAGGDIARLVGLYKRLSVAGRRALDMLELFGETHQDDLARRLGVGGASGLAGLMGHITKTANSIDRVSPVVRDADAKTYALTPAMTLALRQASLYAYCPTFDGTQVTTQDAEGWILDPQGNDHFQYDYNDDIFVHRFPYKGEWWEISRDRPFRYLMFEGFLDKVNIVDGLVLPGFYRSREEIAQEDQEVFHDGGLGLEFFPDHEHKVLVGHSSSDFNEVWPHDVGTVYAEATRVAKFLDVADVDQPSGLSGDAPPLHESFGAERIGPPEEW